MEETSDIDRRSVLAVLGTAAITSVAGCNSSEDEPSSNETTQDGVNTQSEETTTDGESSGPLEMVEVASGEIGHAAGADGTLTYTTDGNRKRVIHGDTKYPAFDDISRGQAPQRNEYISVDTGIAYHGTNRGGGTVEEVIMAGDEELYRETFETSADPNYVAPSARLWDALDGKPIWSAATNQRFHSSFMIGDEEVNPDFDGVSNVVSIGGEVTYVGLDRDDNDRWYSQGLVQGNSTAVDLISDDEAFDKHLEDIGGTPAFVKDTQDGRVVQYGDREIGSEYTEPGDGDFQWIGELDGSLAFIADVARDRIEGSRTREQALWFEGEEIDRSLDLANQGLGIAHTDKGLAYSFNDGDTQGIKIGDTVKEDVGQPSYVASVNGTPAYDAPGEGGIVVVYGDEQTEPQYLVREVFEVDGDLGYLAQTSDGAPDSDAIYREA